ncbi:ABC transporter ATP-binding protein [Kurthia sibirica]|uniref:Multidrug ABC transporter ATP-binding protein n=1 Tax=Kurthia sibirica TaxID=202750 RepID=A0A2U3ALR2_9BACL|nr:ABC transporter ATP-binding protein [Kurthia sibirica]PWI25447.1 multidrug ABC transporter ATP-binding protein [Kurthia sibirica]GEK34973.1 multidrug ABC transporter ATP-binding protein [Kurthia sibirica]
MAGVRYLLTYLKPYIVITILAPLLMVVEVITDLLQPTIMQYIIDDGIANDDFNTVLNYTFLMLGVAVIGLIGGLGCIYLSSKVGLNLATDVRADLYEVSSYFSARRRNEVGTGKLVTILTSDIEMVQRALMMTLRIFVRGPLMFIGAIIIVWLTARELFPILLIIVPILIILIALFTMYSGKIFGKVQRALDAVNTKLSENLAGIQVIKAFHRLKEQIIQFTGLNATLTKHNQNANILIGFLGPLSMFIINMGIIAALWLGAIKIDTGTMQIGVILAFINYLNIIMGGLMMSMMVLMQIARALPSATRIKDVLLTEDDLKENGGLIKPIEGDIEFKNINFAYHDHGENVLENITLHIKKGQTIGFIGMTGSGKSTLLNLIPRLYDAQQGEILIDGEKIERYDVNYLRSQIAIAPQKATLFTGTIASNLKFGNEQAKEAQMVKALNQASAWNFVSQYDQQLQFKLTQNGGNLSGGQKQRIAMARAFIRNANILILDDTTSAVDTISEKIIQQQIAEDFIDKTVIIVSSKVSSIQNADQIAVFEDGKIIAIGTHEQLLLSSVAYRETFELQQQNGGLFT